MMVKYLNVIINDYQNTFHRSVENVSINLTDDIFDTYFLVRPDHKNKLGEELPDLHGVIVPPNSLDGSFIILVDLNYLLSDIEKDQFGWLGTIVHEYTHVIDFIDYAKLTGANNYDEILDKRNHYLFHMWTEFHARHHGYYFVRKYSFENMKDDSQIEFIFGEEMPYQIKNMVDIYSETDDMLKQIDALVQLFGRLSVWNELFPQYFTSENMKQIFNDNLWMLYLYNFFNTHFDLQEYLKDIDELKGILKMNFKIE
jgi:hypothetical protein